MGIKMESGHILASLSSDLFVDVLIFLPYAQKAHFGSLISPPFPSKKQRFAGNLSKKLFVFSRQSHKYAVRLVKVFFR